MQRRLSQRFAQKLQDIEYFGATGPLMRAQGVETVVNSDELAIMGILEVAQGPAQVHHAFRNLKAAAIERRPMQSCWSTGPSSTCDSRVPFTAAGSK
jgi:lipid A disaccharide synthetase